MIRLRRFALPLFALAVSLLAACSEQADSAPADGLPKISVGDATLRMDFATNDHQRRRGLMFRDGIDEDYGLLFVFDQPQQMSFWMRNVSFPIDIGYFTADGVLREVYPMYAYDEQSRRSQRDDLLYALEVSSGWFRKHGVKPGDKLDLKAVKEAMAND